MESMRHENEVSMVKQHDSTLETTGKGHDPDKSAFMMSKMTAATKDTSGIIDET